MRFHREPRAEVVDTDANRVDDLGEGGEEGGDIALDLDVAARAGVDVGLQRARRVVRRRVDVHEHLANRRLGLLEHPLADLLGEVVRARGGEGRVDLSRGRGGDGEMWVGGGGSNMS